MSLYFSTKLIGVLLLIMSITYFAEGVILGNQDVITAEGNHDEDTLMLGIKTPSNTSQSTFETFMNINYIYAKADSQLWHHEISQKDFDAIHNYYLNWTGPNVNYETVWGRMKTFREGDKNKFDKYQTGMNFYNNFPTDGWFWETSILGTNQKWFQDRYQLFLNAGGSNHTYQKAIQYNGNWSFIKSVLGDSADKAIGSFTSGIGKFIDLVSFDVKNGAGADLIPGYVRAVLLVFFIPMWALVILELASLATQIVQAVKFW